MSVSLLLLCRRLLVPCLAFLLAWALPAQARELAVPPEAMVEVEVATVGMSGMAGVPVVLLREPGAGEVIPIYIGVTEARAILRALTGERPPRPLTHELLGDVLAGAEVALTRVYVDALTDSTFLGMLELTLPGRETPLRIDSRPSDAIALALTAGASIHVAPEVLEAARQIEYQGFDDQVVVALGITVTPLDDDLREALGLPDSAGVLVSDVSGDAAEAGLVPGAMLLEVNGETPDSPLHFLELVRDTPEGEPARLRAWQRGEIVEVELSTEVPEPRPRRRTPGLEA
ncbi:MAG: bifunctional nuclease family protein [Halomonas sp.]|uniref:bifunctional nuclease domain-containing protein n=1 Tax=Halomonas sp. TaxID=1486246 RepID=UPI001A04248A|nr:bifunctional nuclease domain-containing protein [Halomonas sp.]MBE0488933.1 bifunctional nuclease family protein [Halomonas sp.]